MSYRRQKILFLFSQPLLGRDEARARLCSPLDRPSRDSSNSERGMPQWRAYNLERLVGFTSLLALSA